MTKEKRIQQIKTIESETRRKAERAINSYLKHLLTWSELAARLTELDGARDKRIQALGGAK